MCIGEDAISSKAKIKSPAEIVSPFTTAVCEIPSQVYGFLLVDINDISIDSIFFSNFSDLA